MCVYVCVCVRVYVGVSVCVRVCVLPCFSPTHSHALSLSLHTHTHTNIYTHTYSDSSKRLAWMSTSEEMGQARDTRIHVMLNAVNSTSLTSLSRQLLEPSARSQSKKTLWNVRLKNQTSKLNFFIRDKISFVGAHAKVTPVAHGGRPCSQALYRSYTHIHTHINRKHWCSLTGERKKRCSEEEEGWVRYWSW